LVHTVPEDDATGRIQSRFRYSGTMATVKLSPIAPSTSIIQGDHYRLTILTDALVRFEWSDDGGFEDGASTFAINRELPTPNFKKVERDGGVEVITERFHLEYDQKPFSPSGFTVLLTQKGKYSHMSRSNVCTSAHDYSTSVQNSQSTRWRYTIPMISNHGGTARTLDEIDGRCPLEDGILSKVSISLLVSLLLLCTIAYTGP